MNNPRWFDNDPQVAWGFFAHCHNMYKSTEPHEGFQILKSWTKNKGYFIYTSNVDGHFQKAGFDKDQIVEVHGSIYHLQCINPKDCSEVWPIPENHLFKVDEEQLRLLDPCPRGPPPGEEFPTRPNILMFGDWRWVSTRTDQQELRFLDFKKSLIRDETPFVIVEIGAGLAVPTVRLTGEGMIMPHSKTVLIRINTFESHTSKDDIAIPLPSLEAIQRINELIKG
jgi:NAD-dependent SIR2 family protein deacetylase